MHRKKTIEKDVENYCEYYEKNKLDFSDYNFDRLRNEYNKIVNEDTKMYSCKMKCEYFKLKNKKLNLGTVKVLFFYPNDYDEDSHEMYDMIYYIHGGLFCFGGDEADYKLPRELCNKTNSIVVYPLYSLSPEAKYPIALEQCYEILYSLEYYSNNFKINYKNLSIGGDCSGGCLVFAISMLCKKRNGPNIKKQFLINPIVDFDFETQSFSKYGNGGYSITKDEVIGAFSFYLDNEKQLYDFLVIPNIANKEQLNNLPPTLIIVGEFDPLKDSCCAFSEKLKNSNVPILCLIFPGAIHNFTNIKKLRNTKCSKAGVKSIITFIKNN